MSDLNNIEVEVSETLLPSGSANIPIELSNFKRLESCENPPSEYNDERRRIYNLFVQYDKNGDNRLDVNELKQLISQQLCRDMSRGLTYHILRMHDPNGDRKLNFEEFYKLSQDHKWLITSVMDNYCNSILPAPPARQSEDDDDYDYVQTKWCPPPLTMIIFSTIEIIFFLVDVIYFHDDPENKIKFGENMKGPAATMFIYNPYRRFEIWRFVTYMFVHVGAVHLVMNLFVQIFLGIALEYRHHWWRVSLIYLAGVLAGSLGTSLTTPTSFLTGASAGVYALLTAHIATVILNWNEMKFGILQIVLVSVYCMLDLGTSIYRYVSDQSSSIGYVAHITGAFAGLLVGIGVLRNLEVHRWEKILWWICVIIYCVFMISCIIVHLSSKSLFPIQE